MRWIESVVMTRNLLGIAATLLFACQATTARSQDLVGFDRSSFGNVVLSRNQSAGSGSDVEFELSFGAYNNESIRNYSSESVFSKMGRAVGRLDILTDAGIFPCTAFIVDQKYLLTNHHCVPGILDNEKAQATRIDAVQFVAGYVQQGVEEGTKTYTVSPTPVETHKDLDYTLLEVIGDPSAKYGKLALSDQQAHDGDPYWVIGHPMGEAQRISREQCRANAPALSNNRLLHTCDTLPGNSGSPVIDAGLQQVIGLHHAGSKKDSVNFCDPHGPYFRAFRLFDSILQWRDECGKHPKNQRHSRPSRGNKPAPLIFATICIPKPKHTVPALPIKLTLQAAAIMRMLASPRPISLQIVKQRLRNLNKPQVAVTIPHTRRL